MSAKPDPSLLQLVPTADGSTTLYNPALNVHYHSTAGARGETDYVFIQQSGLPALLATRPQVRILEVGLGTGLNALAAASLAARYPHCQLHHTAYEPHPLPRPLLEAYHAQPGGEPALLPLLYGERSGGLPGNVTITVRQDYWTHLLEPDFQADVVFYDAFAHEAAPELWTPQALTAAAGWLAPGGVLVCYGLTGVVRRALEATPGLTVERPKGYARKRHMLRVSRAVSQ